MKTTKENAMKKTKTKRAKPTAGAGTAQAAEQTGKVVVTTEPRGIIRAADLKVPAGADDRVTAQFKAIRGFEVGKAYKYTGRNKDIAGKMVTLVGFMPDGGCRIVDATGLRRVCAPYSIGAAKASTGTIVKKKAAR